MKTAQEKTGRMHFMRKTINDPPPKVKTSHAGFFPPAPQRIGGDAI